MSADVSVSVHVLSCIEVVCRTPSQPNHLPVPPSCPPPLLHKYTAPPADLNKNPPDGVSVGLGDDDNIMVWEIMLIGPAETMYEGGFFKAMLEFPPEFPNMPPTVCPWVVPSFSP